jgi:hypothetical protein
VQANFRIIPEKTISPPPELLNAMHETSLLQRIERLECQNRRLKVSFSALGLVLFLGLATLFSPVADGTAPAGNAAEVVEAERFVLRGPDGEEACVLGLDGKGFPHLVMRKDKSHGIMTLNGPAILLRGADGKRSAFMGIDTHGSTRLELTSERIVDGIRLAVKPDGAAGLYLLDQTGRSRLGLEASLEAGSLVVLRNAKGEIRSSFGLDPKEIPALLFFDEVGRRRAGWLVDETGVPLLAIEDERGRPRIEITSRFDGSPLLRLSREDGGVIFEAP